MKKRFLTTAIFLILSAGLYAQSTAQEIETLLETRVVTYAQASRFVLEAADELTTDDPRAAFDFAVMEGWLPRNVSWDENARLNHISRLLVCAFEVRGGIMYRLTKSSHYAYRELKYLNVIQNRSDPSMLVSGERLLFYVTRLDAMNEGRVSLAARRRADQAAREAIARREAMAAEIAAIIEEQEIADTTVEATDEGVMITLSNIMFAADSAVLPTTEFIKLQEIARILSSISGIRIQFSGHTTNIGSPDYLIELSTARARSVADYLISQGAIARENVEVIGFGGERPIASNDTPEGQEANRRVEITILENLNEE